jgi:hypothetical protein
MSDKTAFFMDEASRFGHRPSFFLERKLDEHRASKTLVHSGASVIKKISEASDLLSHMKKSKSSPLTPKLQVK